MLMFGRHNVHHVHHLSLACLAKCYVNVIMLTIDIEHVVYCISMMLTCSQGLC